MTRRWCLWLTLLVCGSGNAATIELPDARGGRISLTVPADRVVSLAPFITELMFAVGAGGALVGVSEYSDYPPAARELPRVANAFGADFETIVSLRPQVILGWRSGSPRRVLDMFERLGLPVLTFEPRRTRDVEMALIDIGRLTGRDAQGQQAAARFKGQIDALRREYADRERISVFYAISSQPLMTLNGDHMVSEIIELCGGFNVFADLPTLAPTLTREAALAAQARVMLASSTIHDVDRWLEQWRQLRDPQGDGNAPVFKLDANLINRQTPRLVDGARQLCELLERAR